MDGLQVILFTNLSIMYNRSFIENMTDGVGYLALAMVIFGRWNAWGIVAAGLFFGLVRAIELYDVNRGARFSTYAYYWIRQYVSRAVADRDEHAVQLGAGAVRFERERDRLERRQVRQTYTVQHPDQRRGHAVAGPGRGG